MVGMATKISIIMRQALKFGDHHRATLSNTKVAIYFPFAGLRRNLRHGTLHSLSGWWFQTFFYFPFHIWDNLIYGMSSFPLTNSNFSRWLLHHQPIIYIYIYYYTLYYSKKPTIPFGSLWDFKPPFFSG